ncbi:MAG: amidohydrolase [Bacteroidales bacterium]|nr:amidohydrolase [Bacteroidales bacterium]
MKNTLTIAIIQPQLQWEQIDANLKFFERKICSISSSADLVILPETFTTGFTMQVEQYADTRGRVVEWMKKLAHQQDITLTGSCIIKEGTDYFNRLYWVSSSGEVQYYDKRHLFRFGREQEFFTPGNRRVIVTIGAFRVLLQICYDLRFPVFSRNRQDYEVILYVANWPTARKKVWEILLPARAIENQAFVIGANCSGTDGEGVENCGGSCVIDPKGNIKTRLNDQPGILFSTIDIDNLLSFRENFPVRKDADDFNLLLPGD